MNDKYLRLENNDNKDQNPPQPKPYVPDDPQKKDIDESTTHERPKPQTEPPTERIKED